MQKLLWKEHHVERRKEEAKRSGGYHEKNVPSSVFWCPSVPLRLLGFLPRLPAMGMQEMKIIIKRNSYRTAWWKIREKVGANEVKLELDTSLSSQEITRLWTTLPRTKRSWSGHGRSGGTSRKFSRCLGRKRRFWGGSNQEDLKLFWSKTLLETVLGFSIEARAKKHVKCICQEGVSMFDFLFPPCFKRKSQTIGSPIKHKVWF